MKSLLKPNVKVIDTDTWVKRWTRELFISFYLRLALSSALAYIINEAEVGEAASGSSVALKELTLQM